MLANDQLGATDLVKINNNSDVVVPRALLKSSIVDSYIATITELHKI